MAKKKRKKEKRLPVLLLQDHPHLGQQGTVVLVKPGYYRFLVSKNIATLATEEELQTNLQKELLTEKISHRKQAAENLKERIENLVLEFTLKKDKSGKLFGSVTKEKIAKALKEKGIQVAKNRISLENKLNKEGEYDIKINLGYDILVNLKVKVKIE